METWSMRGARQAIFPSILLAIVALSASAQKNQTWVEVRSPNFVVVGDGGEKQARRVAEQFEQFRAVFQNALPKARVDLGKPLLILAAKNEKSLKELLPEYWEGKGTRRPDGIFFPSQEKLFVALRTDTYGEFPYSLIYHEYVHALVNLNLKRVPTWLNEGLAEFYGHTVLGNKKVGLGRPNPSAVLLLRREKPLPLDVLFSVDHNSPHYNENTKASIFYAQSWALVHYLMFNEDDTGKRRLPDYLNHLDAGVEPLDAAQRAFGDLKQLEKALASYLRETSFKYYNMDALAKVDEDQFPARVLPPAESAALLGDFHAHRNRPVEARALLDQAISLDPHNALAHESMGFLYLRQQNMEEAGKWFEKAAELDSKSYLALYFSAMMATKNSGPYAVSETASARLVRALELNPDFAPAHSLLANIYQFKEDTREKALHHALKAAQLEPGYIYHRINLAGILLNMQHLDDAISVAQGAVAAAQSDQDRKAAQMMLDSARRFKEIQANYSSQRQQSGQAAPEFSDAQRPALARRSPSLPAAPSEPLPPAFEPQPLKLTGKKATAIGTVTETVCGTTALALTLSRPNGEVRLLSPNYFKLDFMAYPGWEPPRNFQPCVHLAKLRVKVSFTEATNSEYAGEITLVEVLKP